MSIDRISYPLPTIVNGYACLTQAEVELANRDIDPARPEYGPGGRDAATDAKAGTAAQAQRQPDDARSDQAERILSYAPNAILITPADKATTYSVTA
ncbi:hypothetical protein ASG11_01915 [Sphingomonas sp. Leaf357]|uniref:hypothetical protein n=1 Tax=Sphingomonas sp. Leaf357 TaxID=1736350 RepID=UPI0006FF947B|nr:hypothetical protein [Sphingomonas sp. Leaf357]KQS03172.1 hypothetical protein ASG11_01915 [Sphingomonas sp. Leaf357]